jgi:two-component system, chemotaxis family, sensor histidine kinase and response regulator WspE
MSQDDAQNLNDVSLEELFRREIESQSAILTDGLLALERDSSATHKLGDLMRAAHSLKGAARIVGCEAAVRISHVMEDCFVDAQKKSRSIDRHVDALLRGVDLLVRIGQLREQSFADWGQLHQHEIELLIESLRSKSPSRMSIPTPGLAAAHDLSATDAEPAAMGRGGQPEIHEHARSTSPAGPDRALRVTADNLNRLLGLAGESLVASRWHGSFVAEMRQLRRLQDELVESSERLRESLSEISADSRVGRRLNDLRRKVAESQLSLSGHLAELDLFDRRFAGLSTRLYQEVVDCRMRPFSEGTVGFPRLVRDLGRTLGKSVKLEVTGEETQVDRDILELVQAPMDHLVRNAIDHGIEAPGERERAGKPAEGVVRLESTHSAGKLLITISDDGRGIDRDVIRRSIVEKKLTTTETAEKMSDAELLEFLFLPGFTLKDTVSEISGRGVGLDVVQTMVKSVGGTARVFSRHGEGTRFQLELPLTLSVVRTLVVEIGGEPYAFPLARVDTALKLPVREIQSVEGRQHFSHAGSQVGIVTGSEILELGAGNPVGDLSIIVVGNKSGRYGLIVDRFLGEEELVVRPLDPRLGKVKNISAAALMPDGSPLLIIDIEDLIREIERFLSGHRLTPVGQTHGAKSVTEAKRVLVVDDSLTVRELERKLLDGQGYRVDVAVDGMDGWNAVRTGHYDLVLTDVDMPRMDGIELVKLIRNDNRLKSLPVMIVSYKDRPEDRQRGLDAGADYYLTKGSFHDQTLVRAVADLIGETHPCESRS